MKSPVPPRDPGVLLLRGILFAVMLYTIAVRIRLLTVPFERDEGEYAYAGQLILQGIPPYRLAYNMKLPGTYAAYAVVMALFGETVPGVRLGLLLVTFATTGVLYLLARRLFGTFAALAAAAAYLLLSLSPSVLGLFAHATHFVLLPALGGLLLLVNAVESRRPAALFGSGALLGLGFVMKQHGLFFVLFGLAYLVLRSAPRRSGWRRLAAEAALFGSGAALPFALTCLILYSCGVFKTFWFWTFDYARTYVTEAPIGTLSHDLPIALRLFAEPITPLCILAAAGLVALFRESELKDQRLFLTLLLVFSFLAVLPGYFLRPHYFVLMLPVVAMLAGLSVEWVRRMLSRARANELAGIAAALAAILLLVACLATVYPQAPYDLGMTPQQVSRATYGLNPFPEAVEVGAYIAAHSAPGDRVAVLGSEPEIYFYSGRRSATGHIYMYGLMEEQPFARTMQEQAIREIEDSAPRYVVFVSANVSWLRRDGSEPLLLDWLKRYVGAHYRRVGLLETLSEDETVSDWGPAAAQRPPRSPFYIEVEERRPAGPAGASPS